MSNDISSATSRSAKDDGRTITVTVTVMDGHGRNGTETELERKRNGTGTVCNGHIMVT
jgi:hypothetical protein